MDNDLEVLMKKIDGRYYLRMYWPTSYRYEIDSNDYKPRYHIYVENEEVEVLPYWASEWDAEKRFKEILDMMGITCDDMYVWREI